MTTLPPDWISDLPFAALPPFLGLGAARMDSRPVIAVDTETYAMPERHIRSPRSKRASLYLMRKAPRLVCGSFCGRGGATPIPQVLLDAEASGRAAIQRQGSVWRALTDRVATLDVVRHLLTDGETLLVAHNAAFDLGVLCAANPGIIAAVFQALSESRITDTMVREMLLKIAFGQMQDEAGRGPRFDLASIVKGYGLADRSASKKGPDVWRLRYHELDGVPLAEWPSAAVQYALDDAEDALNVAILQAPLGRERRSEAFFPITTKTGGVLNEIPQVRAAWALHLMSLWGMRVDANLHRSWGEDMSERVEMSECVARKAGFLRPDGSEDKKRIKALVEADFKARGEEPPRTSPSKTYPHGQTSTSKDTLLQCDQAVIEYDGREVQALKMWGETSFLRKMQSTYYRPAALGIDHAMPYAFNVLVATGRTSGRRPNMQNPPRQGVFRELFVARPGKIFSSVDYAAEELRTLAQLHQWWFGSSALRDAFIEGEDPHAMFGARLAGVDYDTFKEWKSSKDPRYKAMRQAAKAANFGYPGGLGAEAFCDYARTTYGVDLAEVAQQTGWYDGDLPEDRTDIRIRYAKHLKTEWLTQWSEAKLYMDRVAEELQHSDTFTYLQPVSWRQRGRCYYTSGNNTGFQGLAADAAKEALWRLAALCYVPHEHIEGVLGGSTWPEGVDASTRARWSEALYGCRPVLFIHDEIIVEGPEETGHLWAVAQSQVMEASAQIWTPDVPQIAEPALMRRWYKGAEPVYDDAGRLIPWEPE